MPYSSLLLYSGESWVQAISGIARGIGVQWGKECMQRSGPSVVIAAGLFFTAACVPAAAPAATSAPAQPTTAAAVPPAAPTTAPGAAATKPAAAASSAPVAAASAAAAAAPTGGFPTEVKIGELISLTGNLAQTGEQNRIAVQLAVDVINNVTDLDMPLAKTAGLPNLGGAKIVPIFSDHQGSPEKASADVERLVSQDKVAVLVGATTSAVTLPASQTAERLNMPFVTDTATSTRLGERNFKNWFRPSPHDGSFANDQFRFLSDMKKRGAPIETVSLVFAAEESGQQNAAELRQLAAKSGFKVATEVSFPVPATELTSEVQRLKAANADVVLLSIVEPNSVALLLKTARDLDYNPKQGLGVGSIIITPEYSNLMGKLGVGTWGRSAWALDLASQKPMIKTVNDMYRARSNNRDMSGDSARAFTTVIVVADAINRAGSTDPEKIRQALRQTNVPGSQLIVPSAGVKFDAQGENELASGVVVQMREPGQLSTIWPFDLAAQQPIWPWPVWSARP